MPMITRDFPCLPGDHTQASPYFPGSRSDSLNLSHHAVSYIGVGEPHPPRRYFANCAFSTARVIVLCQSLLIFILQMRRWKFIERAWGLPDPNDLNPRCLIHLTVGFKAHLTDSIKHSPLPSKGQSPESKAECHQQGSHTTTEVLGAKIPQTIGAGGL